MKISKGPRCASHYGYRALDSPLIEVIRGLRATEGGPDLSQALRSPYGGSFQKSLGAHKILVRKIWFYPPPPKRAQNEGKTVQISIKSSKLTLFPGGGGGKRDFMDKAILWTSGRF